MGVKYRIDFKDDHNSDIRIDIRIPGYESDIIPLRALSNAHILSYGTSDNPFEPIIPSKIDFGVYNRGEIDVLELQVAGDFDIGVDLYVSDMDNVKWTGYLNPDGIQNYYRPQPYDMNLSATDGLKIISDKDFIFIKNGSDPTVQDLIEAVVSDLNLGIDLPVVFDVDMESYSNGTIVNLPDKIINDKFYTGRKCLWIIEEICRATSCRFYQKDGSWIFEQILRNGNKSTKVIGSSGYIPVERDQYLKVIPGLQGVDVKYEYEVNEDVITNGSFDEVDEVTNLPTHWRVTTPTNANTHSAYFGYKNRDDIALQISENNAFSEKANIDAYTVFKSVGISFDWMPVSGFSVDGDGFLDNTTAPLFYIQLTYHSKNGIYWDNATNQYERMPEKVYVLTEFGYFRDVTGETVPSIPFRLNDIANGKQISLLDVLQINFDKFGDIKLPNPGGIDNLDDINLSGLECESYLQVTIFPSQIGGTVAMYGNLSLSVDRTDDVYEVREVDSKYTDVEEVSLKVSSSFNSFIDTDLKTLEKDTNIDSRFDVFLHGMNLSQSCGYQMLRFRNKPSIIYDGSVHLPVSGSFSFGEMYSVDGITGKVFMPMQASYNLQSCKIKVTLCEFRNEEITFEITHRGGDELDEGAPVTLYYNTEQSKSFPSSWRQSHCDPANPVEYVVPAGTYQSTLSQADADQKALDDIAQNGKRYANSITYC